MIKRIAKFTLVTMLISTFCGSSVSARFFFSDEVKPVAEKTATTDEAKKQEKLRTDILQLVADAKAGKVAPAPRPQIQPPQSNSLSKRTKIAIAVGVAVAIVVIIVAVKADKSPGPIGAF